MGRKIFLSFASLPFFMAAEVVAAAEEPEPRLSVFSSMYFDTVSNVRGGLTRRSAVLFDESLGVEGNLEKLFGWTGGRFLLSGHAHTGRSPSHFVGDYQFTDSLEAPEDLELYESWLQQRILPNTTIRAGLLDYNLEFQHLDASWEFLNSSFALTPELGALPVSTFPFLGPGVRLSFDGDEGWYGLLGLFDGVPVDPNKARGTRVAIDEHEGGLTAVEGGYAPGDDLKIALGGWLRTTRSDFLTNEIYRRNSGAYLLGQFPFLSEGRVTGFFQLSVAEQDRNPIGHYFSAGLVCSEPFPGRTEDRLMAGVNRAFTSENYRRASGIHSPSETAVELSYSIKLPAGFKLQPDIQYIHSPAGLPEAEHAWVLSFRVRNDFSGELARPPLITDLPER